jgi:hypothetical protein
LLFLLSLSSYAKEEAHEFVVKIPDLGSCSQYKDTLQFYEQGACSKLIYDFNNKLNFYWGSKENKKESLRVFYGMWINEDNNIALDMPLIKLNLVYLLGQAKWFGYDEISNAELREYTLRYLDSKDAEIVSSAISALSIVGENQDIEFLRGIILTEKKGSAEKALSATVMILKHHDQVSPFMAGLFPYIKRESLRVIIKSYM